ncbi:MAG: ATPase, partial [Micromonosporaceae bacterium]|nr:ATPase [Micromonosporaceae bacterium]
MSVAPERLVLGLDIGGTSTRALLATTTGRRIGSGRCEGANPAANGVRTSVDRIVAAVAAALSGTDPGTVAGCVAGLAGAGQHAADAGVAEAFRDAW